MAFICAEGGEGQESVLTGCKKLSVFFCVT